MLNALHVMLSILFKKESQKIAFVVIKMVNQCDIRSVTVVDWERRLFTRDDAINGAQLRNFHENIRKFNGMFAMASMEAKTVNFNGGGPYCYKVQGQIHHTLNLAVMADEQRNGRPKYGQIFLLDKEEALDHRFSHPAAQSCDDDLARDIEMIMRAVNPVVRSYKMMLEVEKEMIEASDGIDRVPQIRLLFNVNAPDQNRYNLPRVNEVAAVFVSPDGNDALPPSKLVMYPRGMQFEELHITNPMCVPMSYPLLFANGGFGWDPQMRYENTEGRRQRVSLLEYYAYVTADRRAFSPILRGGRLFQQFIVDGFVKVEQERLEWVRKNQNTLKADSYIGLHDYLDRQAELQGVARGKTVILPSTFNGGDRYFAQTYQDAMAIVREHGTPDLFVTMTCNATWPEIVNNLKPGQTASDRPDMVAKVFKLKLAEFMDDIVKKGVVGKVRAYVNVIEFQKRGLPHVHMLLILEEPYKLRTAEDVDSLVWAELPDPEQYPRLHEIVKKMMMHGPCGPGTRSPCMEKFKTRCSKRFPKDYSEETVLEENQIPRYRRRESAPSFEGRGGVKMDSRWVVPYNPYLMTKYNAHINVEICTSVRCVKYLFKYIYKGHDKANVFICESGAVETEQPRDRLDHDEVKNFTDARYVGAPEAAWRLKKYSMQDKSHHIERLAVHLQGEQLVYSRETEDNERVMERAEESETTLTAWFALNQRDPNARQYLYGDIPRHYTWNKKDKKWQPRQAHFNRELSEDWIFRTNDEDLGIQIAYADLERRLNLLGKSLAQFGMSAPEQTFEQLTDTNDVIDRAEEERKGEEMYGMLNADQKAIVDLILRQVRDENLSEKRCHFVDGPGGSGKTFVYKTLIHILKGRVLKFAAMAFTGIAAQLLPNGRTIHSHFKLSIVNDTTANVIPRTREGLLLRDASVLIIDEASMVSKNILNEMDRKLREIMQNDHPFGGKIMLFGGDFRQVLPVKRYATRSELVDFCMKSSELWPGFEQHRLSTNMRVRGDQDEFRHWLLALGNGELPEVEDEIIEIPKEFVANGNLVSEIFGDVIAEGHWEEVGKRAILAPKNECCYRINQKVLDLMSGEEVKYKSIDAVQEDESSDTSLYNPVMFPTEFLNSVTHSSLPPHELKLKKNCTVMLLRNLNINEGLCNGTRLRVENMRQNLLICKILSGDKAGETAFIPRITVTTDDGEVLQ
ncbi:hypothetical protein QR680_013034 [Steinernema hermaphroditum]|uniref:ATP-dependent DNA helicase n=1 Tax=Steinernema hermaphroditum TaxID=289476 RepID=A0AA39M0X4_9BILA|nr:hypothetical protein QR680_013034 [Steinernema hermaphroditum]